MKIFSKCIALLLVWCLVLQCIVTDNTKSVHAQQAVKQFTQDNCLIQVEMQAGWDNGYVANVKVTNMGESVIHNWKIELDAGQGEVTNYWNSSLEQDGDKISFHALDYNCRIPAGETASFGYEMNGADFLKLSSMVLIESGKAALSDEQYSITYNITSQWSKGAVIEVSITNCSDEVINDWELSCQFAGQIKDIWNGELLFEEEDTYRIGNKGYNAAIQPGKTAIFGFRAEYPDEIISCPKNETVTERNGEKQRPDCTTTELQDTTTEETTQDSSTTQETTQVPSAIDWEDETDSDKDGLTDVFEEYVYYTDKNKSDTDGDGLPDGFEVQDTQTNPCLADSDGNGILDGEEDLDEDGLSNLEEYQAQTPPLLADADDDGLLDSEELKHQTKWDKEDTDEDGISDYDEVKLGLNPNKPMTYEGIKDSEYASRQKVTAEELEEVNDTIEEFDISFDVRATNYLKHHLYTEVYESCDILNQNTSVVGSPVYYHYSEGEIQEGNIVFSLDKTYISESSSYGLDEMWGIKRYGIFSYKEESGMLVPVSCQYNDEESKILVDAAMDYDNLCIIDLVQLLHNMGKDNTISGLSSETKLDNSLKMAGTKRMASVAEAYNGVIVEAGECAKQVDLVLNIEASYRMGPYLPALKSGLQRFVKRLQEQNIDLRVSLISYKDVEHDGRLCTVVNNRMEEDFLTNISDMQTVIDTIGPDCRSRKTSMVDALAHTNELEYRPEALRIAAVISNSESNIENTFKYINDMDDLFPLLDENQITVCACAPIDLAGEYSWMAKKGGEYFSSDYYNNLYKYIMKRVNNSYKYNAVAGNNLTPVFLDEQLTKGGSCDTDGDGLTDSQETDWNNIRCYRDAQGHIKAELPTLQSLWTALGYGQELYNENPLLQTLSTLNVLPVISFPNLEDSDGDGIIDSEDEDVLKCNPDLIDDTALDDSNMDSDGDTKSQVRARAKSTVTESGTKRGTIVDGSYVCKLNTYSSKKRGFCGELTPKKDSDYIISVKSNYGFKKNTKLKLYKKGKFGKKTEVKYYKSDTNSVYKKQYYYALKKGVTYTVEFSCKTKKKDTIDISCRQDNWVYAKNGAMWKVDMKSLTLGQLGGRAFPLEKCFVTRNMLYAAACENEELYVTDKALIENVMLKLGYSKDKYTITKKEAGWFVVNLTVEAGALVKLFFIPESAAVKGVTILAEKVLANKKSVINVLVGESVSTLAFVDSSVTILNKLVTKLEYNAITTALEKNSNSLQCTLMASYAQRTWDSWKESHLINKYQLGCRGTIDDNITTKDVIDFCGWENPRNRK